MDDVACDMGVKAGKTFSEGSIFSAESESLSEGKISLKFQTNV